MSWQRSVARPKARLGRGVVAMLALAGLSLAAPAVASPVTYEEVLVFPDGSFPPGLPPGQQWYIGSELVFCGGTPSCQSTAAEVLFDLSAANAANPANTATLEGQLIDATTLATVVALPWETHAPDTDAAGYVAGSGLASATLTLDIRGLDAEDDSVRISSLASDGGTLLFQQVFTGSLASTPIVIPFDATMLAFLASDGQFGIRIESFGPFESRDFNLEGARLDATAVPEPASMTLLGLGLVGLAAMARRRRRA